MKKKLISIFLAAAMTLSLTACSQDNGGNDGGNDTANNGGNDAGTTTAAPSGGNSSGETISLRVWGGEEDQALLAELVDDFKAAHPDQNFDIQIGVESESTAKDTILTDISAAADVFAFANDQLPALVRAGAIQNLDSMSDVLSAYAGKSIDDVKNANTGVSSASYKDVLYGFPMSGGNNYFLFYDSNVLSEDDVKTWDTMLEKAQQAGKQVGMTMNSGWYLASFFMGAGFNASTNEDGTTACDWNGTSSDGFTGVQVVEGILGITNSSAFQPVPDGQLSNAIASGDICAIVDGSWDADAAMAAFGDGYNATILPTFTVNGKQVQQYTYSGSKLMGVNALSPNVGWATVLAEFLTNEQSQTKRFEQRQLSPSNKVVAERDDVKSNIAGAASIAQDTYGYVQDVGDKFWDPAATLGELCGQKQLTIGDTDAIQAALDTAVEGIQAPLG